MSAPSFHCDKFHPGLAVDDVKVAADFYTGKLGFWLAYLWGDPPVTAGVNLGNVQVMLNRGKPSPDGCSVYFVVDDVDGLHAVHAAAGVDIVEPPDDKPYGLREYSVHDLHGYTLLFGQHLMPREPQLEIQRVDVPVRLERRLAAVLADLAALKKMSVGECLEETLLHTFERLPEGGVPSPHTERQLEQIAELKRRHGVDYDSHASYRFVEKP